MKLESEFFISMSCVKKFIWNLKEISKAEYAENNNFKFII